MTEYAHLDNIDAGDILIADGGFTCISEGARLKVKGGPSKFDLFVDCNDGGHHIDGQCDENGYLVGFTKE